MLGSPISSPPFSSARTATPAAPTTKPSSTPKGFVAEVAEGFSYLRRYIKRDWFVARVGVELSWSRIDRLRGYIFFARCVRALLTAYFLSVAAQIAAGCAAWWRGSGRWLVVGVALWLCAVLVGGLCLFLFSTGQVFAAFLLIPALVGFGVATVSSFNLGNSCRN